MPPLSWEERLRGLAAVLFTCALDAPQARDPSIPPIHSAVFAAPAPEGITDAPGPRALASAAVAHIKKGNVLGGKAALAEYRAALRLLERYRAAHGNLAYDIETSLALARGFYDSGDLQDARRCWKLAATIGSGPGPGHALLEAGVDTAIRRNYTEALRTFATGFSVEAKTRQYFSTMSMSTADASPDVQFLRGITALKHDDLGSAQQWFGAARDMDADFGEPRLCLAVILLAKGERSRAIEQLLILSTSSEGVNTPDVRTYSEEEAPRAARLLIALTGVPLPR